MSEYIVIMVDGTRISIRTDDNGLSRLKDLIVNGLPNVAVFSGATLVTDKIVAIMDPTQPQ